MKAKAFAPFVFLGALNALCWSYCKGLGRRL